MDFSLVYCFEFFGFYPRVILLNLKNLGQNPKKTSQNNKPAKIFLIHQKDYSTQMVDYLNFSNIFQVENFEKHFRNLNSTFEQTRRK